MRGGVTLGGPVMMAPTNGKLVVMADLAGIYGNKAMVGLGMATTGNLYLVALPAVFPLAET